MKYIKLYEEFKENDLLKFFKEDIEYFNKLDFNIIKHIDDEGFCINPFAYGSEHEKMLYLILEKYKDNSILLVNNDYKNKKIYIILTKHNNKTYIHVNILGLHDKYFLDSISIRTLTIGFLDVLIQYSADKFFNYFNSSILTFIDMHYFYKRFTHEGFNFEKLYEKVSLNKFKTLFNKDKINFFIKNKNEDNKNYLLTIIDYYLQSDKIELSNNEYIFIKDLYLNILFNENNIARLFDVLDIKLERIKSNTINNIILDILIEKANNPHFYIELHKFIIENKNNKDNNKKSKFLLFLSELEDRLNKELHGNTKTLDLI